MTALAWTDSLVLQQPQIDHTHAEFVALLAEADAARAGPDSALLARFEALVAHTVEHFAMEERWMASTDFGPQHCHAREHQSVLEVMQECVARARAEQPAGRDADAGPLRLAVDALAEWFPLHARSMDAGLVAYLAERGFDPVSGQCSQPLPAAAGASCG